MGGPGFLCLTTYVATLYLTNISDKLHKDRARERSYRKATYREAQQPRANTALLLARHPPVR
ncbi:hypothetical protein EC912_11160 [Luteibacter rhizovicinus]|uniref:Uncharacterized protein n=1 Tax=Luteibacter rhizovicinus TaxID=242606 RepID=A0A4R3YGS4_9GAMM|nr:hypothetical protein EC912_11160 [Luteibacter rhizovicinus]